MLKTIPEIVASIKEELKVVSAEKAVAECQQNQGVIIDVREPAEFAQKSASNTINIPRGLLEMQVLQKFPDASKPIYLHCATGARASFAAEQLKRVGYEQVSIIACQLDDVCQACD